MRSTGYELANVRLTLDWEAGAAVPLGPLMEYDGSAGGAVPEPISGIMVVFKTRSPFVTPVRVGVKVIVK